MLATTLEWSGSFLAILGAVLAINHKKISLVYPWICWLITSLCFIVLFTITSQNGLLTLHIIGVLINSFGLYQWFNKEAIPSKRLMIVLYVISIITATLGLASISYYLYSEVPFYLEWAGSLFGISGSLILASRHERSQVCWIFWTLGNYFVLILTLAYTGQNVLAGQQFLFSVLNVIGLIQNYHLITAHHRISYKTKTPTEK